MLEFPNNEINSLQFLNKNKYQLKKSQNLRKKK